MWFRYNNALHYTARLNLHQVTLRRGFGGAGGGARGNSISQIFASLAGNASKVSSLQWAKNQFLEMHYYFQNKRQQGH